MLTKFAIVEKQLINNMNQIEFNAIFECGSKKRGNRSINTQNEPLSNHKQMKA